MGLDVFDGYNVRARICVCTIYCFPFLVDVVLLFNALLGVVPTVVTAIALISLCQIILEFVRSHGHYGEVGNVAAELLMPEDHRLGCTKARYYRKLVTQEPEFAIFKLALDDPSAFNNEQLRPICEDAVRWIRAKTRCGKEFPLVREENINYGFARNMFALRRGGLWVNGLAIIVLGWAICYYLAGSVCGIISAVAAAQVVCLINHALFFLYLKLLVTRERVASAAKKYAFVLLETIALL